MEAPDPAFEITLNAAQGFFRLGMWNDAWKELAELQPDFRHLPQVMILRVLIYNNLGKWEEAAIEVQQKDSGEQGRAVISD